MCPVQFFCSRDFWKIFDGKSMGPFLSVQMAATDRPRIKSGRGRAFMPGPQRRTFIGSATRFLMTLNRSKGTVQSRRRLARQYLSDRSDQAWGKLMIIYI